MKCYYSDDEEVSWTEITQIIGYPEITTRLDDISACTIVIADFEGALYDTYSSLDFVPIKIEDDSENIIFKGYLIGKVFAAKTLTLTCSGIAERLQWETFNKDYILAHGKVESCPYSETKAGQTELEDPSGDEGTNDWDTFGAGASHTARLIDDSDSTGIAAVQANNNDDDIFEIENPSDIGAGSVTQVSVFVRCSGNVANGLGVDISFDDWVGSEGEVLKSPAGTAWVEWIFDVSGDPKSAAEANALEVKFTAHTPGGGDEVLIYEFYVEFTFSGVDASCLGLYTQEELAFDPAWEDDYWINGQDVGLLITDNTSSSDTTTFECSAIGTTANFIEGDEDSLDTKGDGDEYGVSDAGVGYDSSITPTLSGVGIADSKTLYSIKIPFNIGYEHDLIGLGGKLTITIQLDKNGEWITLYEHIEWGGSGGLKYLTGTIEIPDTTNTELAKWLSKTGNDYTSLKGIKILIGGYGDDTSMAYVYVDYMHVEIEYNVFTISPIMAQITDNGDNEWVDCESIDDWDATGVDTDGGDYFKIGQNTRVILAEVFAVAGVAYALQSTLTKYIARHFKGITCMDVLKSVCLLEGLHWWEDFENSRIIVSKEDDFEDSEVDLTSTDYDFDWKYNDECNHYKKVEVYGQAALNIHAERSDPTSTSLMTKTFIDETISTVGDAQEAVNAQWDELSTKRPSIQLSLKGIQSALTVGKTVGATFERPTIAAGDYPIRLIKRSKLGIAEIKTIIHGGLGSTDPPEKLANTIKQIAHMATKAHSDRLISTPYQTGASFSWNDIGGAEAGARAACIESAVYGAGWNGDNDHAPTQDAVYDKLVTVDAAIAAIDPPSKTHYEPLEMFAYGAATFSSHSVKLDAVDEGVSTQWYAPNNLDVTEDVLIIWIVDESGGDASVSCKKYIRAIKTDNSEGYSWNINSATAIGVDCTNAAKPTLEIWTVTAGDIQPQDIVHTILRLNEAGKTFNIRGAAVVWVES